LVKFRNRKSKHRYRDTIEICFPHFDSGKCATKGASISRLGELQIEVLKVDDARYFLRYRSSIFRYFRFRFEISDFVHNFWNLLRDFVFVRTISDFSDFALKSDFHRNFRSLCCIRASEIAHIFQIFMWRRVGISDLLLKFEKNQICSVKFSIWDNILHFSFNFRFFWFCLKTKSDAYRKFRSPWHAGASEIAQIFHISMWSRVGISDFSVKSENFRFASYYLRFVFEIFANFAHLCLFLSEFWNAQICMVSSKHPLLQLSKRHSSNISYFHVNACWNLTFLMEICKIIGFRSEMLDFPRKFRSQSEFF
jgi:hypothetical protein